MIRSVKEVVVQCLEVQDTDRANMLLSSGEYRLERFSERRDAWMLVRRQKS
jgi:hypothetical protein